MKRGQYLLLLILIVPQILQAQHSKAHAHNDYEHEKPLFDALKNGFTSFEADVYLIEGKLIVSHDYPDAIDWDKTLSKLYLEPLLKLSRENGGRIYQNYTQPIYLLIDIKSDARSTWLKLREELIAYEDLLNTSNNEGPIKVIISGNRPIEALMQETNPPAFLDGRPNNLDQNISNVLMPWISENYFKVIGSFNLGEPTPAQKDSIKLLVLRTHQEGKLLRLWASPDKEEIWEILLESGVDLINSDNLEGLNQFLLEKKAVEKN